MDGRLETRFRLLGVLPLMFFLVQTIHYWRYGGMGNLLWMCNAGNVLLGVGLLLGHREMIRAAAIWTIPGLAIWIKYVLLASGFYFSTTLAHLGGITVGLIALRRIGMDRVAWIYAFAWYLLTQVAARLLAPPDLNVNVAHHVQSGWENVFSSYWKFWIVMTLIVAAGLWVIGFALSLIWRAKSVSGSRQVGIASGPEIQA
ncbi:MAG TPA: hypothetical protein VGQ72_12655 [Pyrinomonadaceae bacterium]|jgi:hypothetical protein|nr:hypothetical protein [Pyrinomonadaceae bacterium]